MKKKLKTQLLITSLLTLTLTSLPALSLVSCGTKESFEIKTEGSNVKFRELPIDAKALSGSEVTFKAKADRGYRIDSLKVLDSSSQPVLLFSNDDDSSTFTMPNSSVTIVAETSKIVTPTMMMDEILKSKTVKVDVTGSLKGLFDSSGIELDKTYYYGQNSLYKVDENQLYDGDKDSEDFVLGGGLYNSDKGVVEYDVIGNYGENNTYEAKQFTYYNEEGAPKGTYQQTVYTFKDLANQSLNNKLASNIYNFNLQSESDVYDATVLLAMADMASLVPMGGVTKASYEVDEDLGVMYFKASGDVQIDGGYSYVLDLTMTIDPAPKGTPNAKVEKALKAQVDDLKAPEIDENYYNKIITLINSNAYSHKITLYAQANGQQVELPGKVTYADDYIIFETDTAHPELGLGSTLIQGYYINREPSDNIPDGLYQVGNGQTGDHVMQLAMSLGEIDKYGFVDDFQLFDNLADGWAYTLHYGRALVTGANLMKTYGTFDENASKFQFMGSDLNGMNGMATVAEMNRNMSIYYGGSYRMTGQLITLNTQGTKDISDDTLVFTYPAYQYGLNDVMILSWNDPTETYYDFGVESEAIEKLKETVAIPEIK